MICVYVHVCPGRVVGCVLCVILVFLCGFPENLYLGASPRLEGKTGWCVSCVYVWVCVHVACA